MSRDSYSRTYQGRTAHGWRSVQRTDFGAYYGKGGSIMEPRCLIPIDEALAFLHAIDRGEITVKPIGRTWDDAFAGNVEFRASNGWRIEIFNDCDSWDYIDTIEARDGRTLPFDELYQTAVDHWYPADAVAAQFFGEQAAKRYAAWAARWGKP